MDIFLIILGLILTIAGIAGCFLPVIPGPPLSYVGLLLIHFTERSDLPPHLLWILAIITLSVTLLDYIFPIWGTKKFGGTKRGITGATIGVIVGLFLGPLGIIIGPFAGAILGEMTGGRRGNEAIRAAVGSFAGFLLGTGLKLMASLIMVFYFFKYTIDLLF